MPGHVTEHVRVPYKVVGLVVGPKGATIKRIQQQTHTYIITPSREKEPIFEVTGLPENVDAARREIEAHIVSRTGSFATEAANQEVDRATMAIGFFTEYGRVPAALQQNAAAFGPVGEWRNEAPNEATSGTFSAQQVLCSL